MHLRKELVFAFGLLLDAYIVLRNTLQHICTFADVHDSGAEFDAVYARVLILSRQPFAGEPGIHIVHIVLPHAQYTNSLPGNRPIFVRVVV